MKFKTKIVSNKPTRTACRPCSVIKKSDGRVLANFESRKACALALGIDSPAVSILVNGGYGYSYRIMDDKHGELQIVDGLKEITKVPRKRKSVVPAMAAWPPASPGQTSTD